MPAQFAPGMLGMQKRFGQVIMGTQSNRPENERRGADRFPIEREVRYKVISKKNGDESGVGSTINISSNGVLFTTEKLLIPGRRLEVSINWPAQLNNKCALKLVARGRVVRFEQGKAAMEIQQYEFRTSGAAAH
ncbi:MAG: PilZ domain-containing protein [Bryobacterales bacterium]|nr:PilZ domain-containing protein [Bryobacterales bacterium]